MELCAAARDIARARVRTHHAHSTRRRTAVLARAVCRTAALARAARDELSLASAHLVRLHLADVAASALTGCARLGVAPRGGGGGSDDEDGAAPAASAWASDDYSDAARRARLAAALAQQGPAKSPFWRARIVARAARSWDDFYGAHGAFFADRAWLERDFVALRRARHARVSLLEFGCGTGASFLPLLERLPQLAVTAFDLSPRAVALAREHATFAANAHRACVFAGDATDARLAAAVAGAHAAAGAALVHAPAADARGFDCVLMLFMLSAMPTDAHARIFAAAAGLLRAGGLLLFRDYGEGDEAQTRFGRGAKLVDDGSVMVRRDGTLAAFLRLEDVARAAAAAGLEGTAADAGAAAQPPHAADAAAPEPAAPVAGAAYMYRAYMNRKTGETLRRVFVHAVFRKPTVA